MADDEDDGQFKPPVRVKYVEQDARAVLDQIGAHVGAKMTTGLARNLGGSISEVLQWEKPRRRSRQFFDVKADVVQQTLMLLSGQVLTPATLEFIAFQTVARAPELVMGPIRLHDRPVCTEWVCVETRTVAKAPWQETKPGVRLVFFALTGNPAGALIEKVLPEGWTRWLAYQIGFSRTTEYDEDPRHFVGLRFWIQLMPSERNPAQFETVSWAAGKHELAENRGIIAKRVRHDVDYDQFDDKGDLTRWACKYEYDHYCFDCAQTSLNCGAAMKRSYVAHVGLGSGRTS